MTTETSNYWTVYQPGLRFSGAPVGSPEFFDEVRAHRYALEPHIPELVQFERWADKDVLEVGCGIATDGQRFAEAGARYFGFDQSDTALSLARARFTLAKLDGAFGKGSATSLPFADASFDLVYSFGVLHHVDRTDDALAEIHRVLRPGGTALIMLYHRHSLNYYVTIMVVRRLLATLLLLPGAVAVVAWLTGEARPVLEGHRELLRTHGPRYLADTSLFLASNTDGPGNHLSKAYSRRQARGLFSAFSSVQTTVRFINLRIYPGGDRIARTRIGRALGAKIGWHLVIQARKVG